MMQSHVAGVPFEQCTAEALRAVADGRAPCRNRDELCDECITISRAIAARLVRERP